MSLLKKLAGETAIYGISSILGRMLNFVIMTPYLTHVFTDDEYGAVSVLYAWAAFLIIAFTYRMETTFFRFASKEEHKANGFSTATWSILLTTLFFWMVLIGFAQPIADFLLLPEHPEYVVWFALIIGFDALVAIPFARLRLDSRPIRFAIIKIFNVTVNALAVLFFLEGCPLLIEYGYDWPNIIYDADNRISYVFLANLIAAGATLLFMLPMFSALRQKPDFTLLKKMLRYAAPLIIVGIAGVGNQVLDRILLERMGPGTIGENTAMVGVYSACYKFAILMALFTQAFNYAAEPFFFRNADRSDSKLIYAQVAQGFTIAGCLGFLCILLYMDLAQYVIGADFRTGLKVVPILLLAYLSLGLYNNFSIWYKLTDKTLYGAYISAIGLLITVVINVVFIPQYGYMASAWAAFACYLTMATLCYFIGRHHFPVPYPMGKILFYVALAISLYFANRGIRLWLGDGTLFMFLANTGLLLAFVAVVGWEWRDKLKAMLFPSRTRN